MQGVVSYHQRYRRCGKSNCRSCGEGPGHGPYWYATWREGAHVRTRYVGKEMPPHLAAQIEGQAPAVGELRGALGSEDISQPEPVSRPARATHLDPKQSRSSADAFPGTPAPRSRHSRRLGRRDLRIWTLGHFRVERGGVVLTDWHRLVAATILKRLLVADRHRIARDHLIDQLWPDAAPEAAREGLAGALHALRRALEPDLAAGARSRYVVQQGESLILTLGEDDWVDLFAFEKLLAEADTAADPLPQLAAAAALYGGELLPEETAEWCIAPREALRLRWHGLLLTLAEAQASHRQHEAAAATLGRLLAADPAHEEAARRLMGLLARQGRRTEALRLYHRLERALKEELDAPPAPETVAIAAALHAGSTLPIRQTGRTHDPFAPTAESPRAVVPPLVGRAQEMAQLRTALLATRDGHGRTVLLSGQAGIGKTKLAEEAATLATTLGFTALWGRAAEDEQDLPYAPIAEVLRAYTRTRPGGALRRDLKDAGALGALLPELATAVPGLVTPPLGDPGAERLRLWTAVRTLLTAASERRPLVLILEDLHWADQATLSLLGFLVRRCRESRLLIVGTVRDEEVAESHPLRRMALEGRRDGSLELLELHELSVEEVDVLARRVFDLVLGDVQVAALHAHGAGNPFFIGELLTLLRERQHDASTGDTLAAVLDGGALLPSTIRQMLAQRLDRVSPTCRALLRAGAVIGERFTATLLAHVAGQQRGAFEDALDEGVATGLLREDAGLEGGGYALLHALLRRALYEELLPSQRQRLHARAAGALIELAETGREPSVELIAYHYARTPEHAVAAQWLERAGDRAAAMYANSVALAQYGLARDHLLVCAAGSQARASREALVRLDEKLGDMRLLDADFARAEEDFVRARGLAADPAQRAGLRRKEGVTWEKRGDFEQALASFTAAENEGKEGPPGRGLPPAVRAEIEVSRGQVYWRRGDYQAAGAAAERALVFLGSEPEQQATAQVYSLLGNVARTKSDFARAEECHRRSLAIRKQLGDQHGLAGSWNNLGMVAHFRGDYARAEECYRQGLAIYERIGDQQGIANCWNSLGLLAHYRGGYAQAEEYHLHSLSIRERIGDQPGIAGSWNNLGLAALYRGHYRRAEDCYNRSLATHERIGDQQNIASCLNNLGLVAMGRGDLAGAEAYYQRSLMIDERLSNPGSTAGTLSNLGDVACERGDFAGAIAYYRRARHLARRIGEPEVQAYAALGQARTYLRSRPLRFVAPPLLRARDLATTHALGQAAVHVALLTAEVYLRQHSIPQARTAAQEALRLATAGDLLQEQAMAQRLMGQCACAEGASAEAERLLATSMRILKEIEANLELARTQVALAEAMLARATGLGEIPGAQELRADAATLLAEAHATFVACGCTDGNVNTEGKAGS